MSKPVLEIEGFEFPIRDFQSEKLLWPPLQSEHEPAEAEPLPPLEQEPVAVFDLVVTEGKDLLVSLEDEYQYPNGIFDFRITWPDRTEDWMAGQLKVLEVKFKEDRRYKAPGKVRCLLKARPWGRIDRPPSGALCSW